MKLNIKNKKADSLIISYVILIVIVLSVASLVYVFLKSYNPINTPECPQGISLMIESATCDLKNSKELTLKLVNNGLFNIPIIFVRMAPENREVRPQINKGSEILGTALEPKNIVYTLDFDLNPKPPAGQYIVEVQPAILEKGKTILCNFATIEKVTCSS